MKEIAQLLLYITGIAFAIFLCPEPHQAIISSIPMVLGIASVSERIAGKIKADNL